MAKGQKKSNREAKKPKKTAAERLKASSPPLTMQIQRGGQKDAGKKS